MKLLLPLAQLGSGLLRKLWVRLVTFRWNIYSESYEKAVQRAMYPDGELREVGKTLNACFVAIKNSHLDLEQITILDAGCGTGFLSSAIPIPRYLVGVDISKRMIKNLRERQGGGGLSTFDYDELHQQDVNAYLRGTESTFHIIVASSAVQFFTPLMLEAFLNYSARSIAPFGCLIFSFDVAIDKARLNSKGFWEYPISQVDALASKYFDHVEIQILEFSRIERGKNVLSAVASLNHPNLQK
jgi:predicted TPR repeat methyltransferase